MDLTTRIDKMKHQKMSWDVLNILLNLPDSQLSIGIKDKLRILIKEKTDISQRLNQIISLCKHNDLASNNALLALEKEYEMSLLEKDIK